MLTTTINYCRDALKGSMSHSELEKFEKLELIEILSEDMFAQMTMSITNEIDHSLNSAFISYLVVSQTIGCFL